jgi:hypothetical protein
MAILRKRWSKQIKSGKKRERAEKDVDFSPI